ncbi:MAG TPA: MFS transporter [Mycobacteriales bacterium]|nr:MFS transporter [Mycobacteriales bacterium]
MASRPGPLTPSRSPLAAHGWRSLAIDIGPLRRHRDFRLLFLGQGTSFLGSMITYVAIPYQVYDLTGSTLLVGLLGLVEFAALMLMALIGGALADSRDRRRMVMATEFALLTCSAVLLGNSLVPDPQVSVLFLVAAVATTFDSLQRPSLDALLPRLVPREDLLPAAALSSLRGNVGMLAGPAIGGLLIAVVGLPATYAVDALTFLFSLGALSMMRPVPPAPDAQRPSLQGILAGVRYARSRPELMGTYLADINAMFFAMPNALFPALAVGFGGPKALGLLYAAPAVGALVASLTSGWAKRIHRHGLGVLWAAAAWGVAIVAFGLSEQLWLALVFLALAGAADMVSGLFRMTIWNSTIPDHLRGRLAGIELIGYSAGPTLGSVRAGGVAHLAGPRWSAVSGGLLCVVGTVIVAVALPGFRRYDDRDQSTTGK